MVTVVADEIGSAVPAEKAKRRQGYDDIELSHRGVLVEIIEHTAYCHLLVGM